MLPKSLPVIYKPQNNNSATIWLQAKPIDYEMLLVVTKYLQKGIHRIALNNNKIGLA